MARHWIKGAIKHPGRTRRFAERHHMINEHGQVEEKKVEEYAHEHGDVGLERAAILGERLQHFRHHTGPESSEEYHERYGRTRREEHRHEEHFSREPRDPPVMHMPESFSEMMGFEKREKRETRRVSDLEREVGL